MSRSKDRLLARREAAPDDAVVGRREPPAVSPNSDLTWEQRHKRATFHFPVELLEELKATAKQRGLSTSALVVQAVESELKGKP